MELKEVIAQTSAQLKEIDTMVSPAIDRPRTIIHKKCYETWHLRSKYHQYLFDTQQLLSLRQVASDTMDRVNDAAQTSSVTGKFEFKYLDTPVPFTSARFLSLQNYLSITWAIYDKLANVCARIIGPVSIGNNPYPARNAKLPNLFFSNKSDKQIDEQGKGQPSEKKLIDRPNGFALQTILDYQWTWPVNVSYKIRNLVVHEGYGGIVGEFFLGDTPLSGFKICENLKASLQKECMLHPKNDEDACLSRLASEDGFPWYGDDIRVFLRKYHSEIDYLYASLLQWSIRAFCDQVKLFSEPDAKLLSLPMKNKE